MDLAMQAAMSLQHERIAAAQFVDTARDESPSFPSQPPPLSLPSRRLLSRPAVDARQDRAVRANRDRYLRWRRDLPLEDVARMEAMGCCWVVFDNEDEPMRCGRTMQEAMQGVSGTAYLGHIIRDQPVEVPEAGLHRD